MMLTPMHLPKENDNDKADDEYYDEFWGAKSDNIILLWFSWGFGLIVLNLWFNGAEVGNICQIEAQAYFFHAVLSEFLAGRVISCLSHKFIQKDDSENDAD